jgi:hypothetical protein
MSAMPSRLCARLVLLTAAAQLLLFASPARAEDAAAPAATEPGVLRLRAWLAGGPYWPPADEPHWLDPRGTAVAVLGVGAAAAPNVFLGVEGIVWMGSYSAAHVNSAYVPSDSRMQGTYTGLGPLAKVVLPYGRWEPWASATLLVVRGEMQWSGAAMGIPGDAALEGRWGATLAIGAGLGYRLWRHGGVELRYEGIPLAQDFGMFSNGSANVGVQAALLSLHQDFTLSTPRFAR